MSLLLNMILLEKLRMEKITMRRKPRTDSWVIPAFSSGQRICWERTPRNFYLLNIQLLPLNSFYGSWLNLKSRHDWWFCIYGLWTFYENMRVLIVIWLAILDYFALIHTLKYMFVSIFRFQIAQRPKQSWSQILVLRVSSTNSLSPTPSLALHWEVEAGLTFRGNVYIYMYMITVTKIAYYPPVIFFPYQ